MVFLALYEVAPAEEEKEEEEEEERGGGLEVCRGP